MSRRTRSTKRILLCADDFAENASVSEGIVTLATHQRINAISCLVNSAYWDEQYDLLRPLQATCWIGLHLNLTMGQPRSAMWQTHEGERFQGLSRLISSAYLQRLKPQVVRAEIQAQLDVFTEGMGCYPDFIDGHQHVHQLPMVREALCEIYHTENLSCFFRNTSNGRADYLAWTGFPKIQAIAALGGQQFKRCLIQEGIPANSHFSGIYPFSNAARYRSYFKHFLTKTQSGGLIMCHPGLLSMDEADPLMVSRQHEFNYLMGDVFLKDLDDNAVQLMVKATDDAMDE